MRLLDADVCVDLIRLLPAADAWFRAQKDELAIPGFVVIELIVGCRDKAALKTLRAFLEYFPVIWATESAMNRAADDYAPLHLSNGLGGFDALIAATAVEKNCVLLTFNTRHFAAVPGLIIQEPYLK